METTAPSYVGFGVTIGDGLVRAPDLILTAASITGVEITKPPPDFRGAASLALGSLWVGAMCASIFSTQAALQVFMGVMISAQLRLLGWVKRCVVVTAGGQRHVVATAPREADAQEVANAILAVMRR